MACGSRTCGRNAKLTRGKGGSYYLPRIVGPAKARELYLLSPVLGGEEAEAIGRVTEVAEPGRVLQAALCLRRRSPRARR